MKIRPQDLFVSTYYLPVSSGWSTPKLGVEVERVPTGTKVRSESERTQHANRQACFDALKELMKALPEQLELDL